MEVGIRSIWHFSVWGMNLIVFVFRCILITPVELILIMETIQRRYRFSILSAHTVWLLPFPFLVIHLIFMHRACGHLSFAFLQFFKHYGIYKCPYVPLLKNTCNQSEKVHPFSLLFVGKTKKYRGNQNLLVCCSPYLRWHFTCVQVRLSWQMVPSAGGYPSRELVREVLEKPMLRLVPHIGYVSLFPFMGRLIPAVSWLSRQLFVRLASYQIQLLFIWGRLMSSIQESWILEKQLDLISNTSILWTKFGLRSLAKTRWERWGLHYGMWGGHRYFDTSKDSHDVW